VVFTGAELAYLCSQRFGRIARGRRGRTIEIGGWNLAPSRKFHNIHTTPQVAFVVGHLESLDLWKVRGGQIWGAAEALGDQ